MSGLRSGLGLAIDIAGAAAWGLAAFFIVARLLSPAAGSLLGLALFLSALTLMIGARLQETKARQLAAGACPRCGSALRTDHQHRRWDAAGKAWLAPLTTWACRGCGFEQDEAIPCGSCPAES